MQGAFEYCPFCSDRLQPFSDGERLRLSCQRCGWVYYRNPTVGVAVVLVEDNCLLLGERRDGGWCIPCGHVEWDEEVEAAARREFAEETGLEVRLTGVLAVKSNFHNPYQHTVGIWYEGIRTSGSIRAGGDLLNLAFYPLDQLPPLKFPTDQKVVNQLGSQQPSD